MESSVATKPAHEEAHEQLEALANELKAQYPQHRITFGYIGNVGRHGDDRCFCVFTCYYDWENRRSVFYPLGGFTALKFDETREQSIRKWVEGLQEQAAKGLIHSR